MSNTNKVKAEKSQKPQKPQKPSKALKELMKLAVVKHEWRMKKPMYINKKDDRYKAYKKCLKKYSFAPSELWNLFNVFAQFIIPRLKEFRANAAGSFTPAGMENDQFISILDDMIFAFEWSIIDDVDVGKSGISEEERELCEKRFARGMDNFGKYFFALWF